MQKTLLLLVATLLIVGCKTKPKIEDEGLAGEPFNLESVDNQVLGPGGEQAYKGDMPLAGGAGMRFVEPNSGLLDPALAAEAQAVLRDIHFAYDSSKIMPNDAAILQQIGAFMNRHADVLIQVGGYCDERGTEEYNMALGSRRAGAAREFLADLGINPNRVYTISYGEENPVDPGHSEAAWAKNRRDHFLVGVSGR